MASKKDPQGAIPVPSPGALASEAPAAGAPGAIPKVKPVRTTLDPKHPTYKLYEGVRSALTALPMMFRSEINITGVLATDLFTFNSALGASIEDQMVTALNTPELRATWDPEHHYLSHRFIRRPQSFPDVVLLPASDAPPVMGIELKGWFVLSKEGEPSFRYKITPKACAPYDLLAVFPWALSNAVSGTPHLYPPFVESAAYVAAYRNWHWSWGMDGKGRPIRLSAVTTPYPMKADPADDEAVDDKGGNYGRTARTGLMDDFVKRQLMELLLGIPISSWLAFLKIHASDATGESIARGLRQLAASLAASEKKLDAARVNEIADLLGQVAALLK